MSEISDLIRTITEEIKKFDRMFESILREMQDLRVNIHRPFYEILYSDNEIKILIELPGVDKDQIKATISNNILTVQAKGQTKSYYVNITLPVNVDEKSAKANYNNGVLQISLKKTNISGTEIKIE